MQGSFCGIDNLFVSPAVRKVSLRTCTKSLAAVASTISYILVTLPTCSFRSIHRN